MSFMGSAAFWGFAGIAVAFVSLCVILVQVRAVSAEARRARAKWQGRHIQRRAFEKRLFVGSHVVNSPRQMPASSPEPSWARVLATTVSLWAGRRLRRIGNKGRLRGFPARGRPALSARGLLGAAAILLPAADRTRYVQEYLSELWDLTQADEGRLRQLLYAFRQLRSAISMSRALRSPRRRGAAP